MAPRPTTTQLDALLRTLAIELPIGVLVLWAWTRRHADRPPAWRCALVVLGCSLLTHPFAWWGNRGLIDVFAFEWRAALIETAVIVVEALLLRGALRVRWPPALGASAAMNAASFGFGLWWMWR